MRFAGVRAFVDRPQPHQTHQATNTMPTHSKSLPVQTGSNLPTAEKGIKCGKHVDPLHQIQGCLIKANRTVIIAGSIEMKQSTLVLDAQERMITLNQVFLLRSA